MTGVVSFVVGRIFVVSLVAQYGLLEYHMIAAQPKDNPAPVGWLGSKDGTVEMQIIIFLTTVAGFAFQIYQMKLKERQTRLQREWDLEDRRLARQEAEHKANIRAEDIKSVAADAAQKSEDAVKRVDERTGELERKLDENTQLTEEARAKLASVLKRFTDEEANGRHSEGPNKDAPR